MTEQNSPLNVIAKMLACASCRLADRAAHCECKKYVLPAHKDPKVTELQKKLLDEKSFRREIQGDITPAGDRVFSSEHIQDLESQESIYDFEQVKVVWIAIDPSAGSTTGSRCSAVAVALNDQDRYVVCS